MTEKAKLQTCRSVGFLLYPGFDILDLAGPTEALNDANGLVGGAYRLALMSPSGGLVASSAGVVVATSRTDEQSFPLDTLIVSGATIDTVRDPDAELLNEIRRLASSSRRTASICTGAFLLAAAGLLDDRRATTHWKYSAELQARAPAARIEADRLFVHDGPICSSAGATAGIDLTIALIEDDLGTDVAKAVARGLVMSHRRLGGQSQYSALLEQEPPSDRIRRVLLYARENLSESLSVQTLAEVAALSERQFSRLFVRETGLTPAKMVEKLRVEAAQPQIEDLGAPLQSIARSVGFSDPEHMRQAFLRWNGFTPGALRRARAGTAPRVR
jgi:transcriptional regulator GlxA family with amidase domain